MKFHIGTFAGYLIVLSQGAFAQSWTNSSDNILRQDVEILKAWDVIDGPVNTWPINWSQVRNGFSDLDTTTLPEHVKTAIRRVKAKMPPKGFRGKAEAYLTNEPALVRSFGNLEQSDSHFSVSLSHLSDGWDVNLTTNYSSFSGAEKNLHFDGSYIAKNLGDWSLYAGAMRRWWGPGQDNTLLYSTNARPMASIGLRRNVTKPFQTKWLSWMGPWTWDMFVARSEKERFIPKALMAGMRLSFEPLEDFEVGLSRNLQLCGEERPCDLDAWGRALISVGDLDNTGGLVEPGNQMASIDFSYSHRFGDKTLRAYFSATAEDQHIVTPFQYARLLGATLSSPLDNNGSMWSLNTEWSDSGNVKAWFFGERRAAIIYNHHIYKTGHRFKGRSLGHSLDNDSKLISVTATIHHASGYRISLAGRSATINWDDTTKHVIIKEATPYKSIELTASNTFIFGEISTRLGLQSRIETLTQGKIPRFNAAIHWQKSF